MPYKKHCNNELWKNGFGLIDTCGRTRSKNQQSTIAFASKYGEFSVRYDEPVKVSIYRKHEQKYPKETLAIIMHCVGLSYCIKEQINNLHGVYICCDCMDPGQIKHWLKNIMKNDFNDEKINVVSSLKPIFGKHNAAHKIAYDVNTGKKEPSLCISQEQIEEHLK